MSTKCFSCGKEIPLDNNEKVSFSAECEHCYADIHSCKMCQFYDKSAYNECRETSADRILEKEKKNFCEYFSLGSGNLNADQKNDALSAAEALFKK